MGSIRMQNNVMRMAELDLRVVQPAEPIAPQESPVVLLLHGFSMRADDLAPFGASMGLPAVFVFPEGPIDLSGAGLGTRGLGGRAWWMIDAAARDAAVARGDDRDLSAERPAGLGSARDGLIRLVGDVRRAWPGRPTEGTRPRCRSCVSRRNSFASRRGRRQRGCLMISFDEKTPNREALT